MPSMTQTPSPLMIWLHAARPRTLPLAAAAIFLGYGLAALHGESRGLVFALALLTAVLLQILSNLANDYGDAVAGADTEARVGPQRMVSSGLASPRQMMQAIVFAVFLATVSGGVLVFVAAWGRWFVLLSFLALGFASLVAAVAYTMGKRPYGYRGAGDVMAGLFFGPVAVLGSALLCGTVTVAMWLPALAAGLCSTAVLNVNNMRDYETDRATGKRTVAVRLGLVKARVYHGVLILLAVLLWILFWLMEAPGLVVSVLFGIPLVWSTWRVIRNVHDAAVLNAQLRGTVLATAFLHCVMAVLCLLRSTLSL